MTTAQKLELAVRVLRMYADTDSYRGMVHYSSSPEPWFYFDFGSVAKYDLRIPGKSARACLRKIGQTKA